MIVIPMAGLSSRFKNAGYDKPKYMLDLAGNTLFDLSISSFNKYFQTEKFIFIIRDIDGTFEFVRTSCLKLNIKNFEIVVLKENTKGQAETVAIALNEQKVKNGERVIIFNIDTFRPNYTFPDVKKEYDGYLEVFRGEGEHWSFIEILESDHLLVKRTTEKERISDLCSTGLYYFRNVELFINAFNKYKDLPIEKWSKGELYIAPLYNILISSGMRIGYEIIEDKDVIFCGTPAEYIECQKSYK